MARLGRDRLRLLNRRRHASICVLQADRVRVAQTRYLMQMIYNSPNYCVFEFRDEAEPGRGAPFSFTRASSIGTMPASEPAISRFSDVMT